MLAWGWRRILLAFAAGAITTLALPPLSVWPAPFLTFPLLVWLVDGAAGGRWGGTISAAVAGWWFGFGYFLAGLYWIGNAFLVDAETFGWLLPFAVILMPAWRCSPPAGWRWRACCGPRAHRACWRSRSR
jgi:apolipoprotein N-acyltransferase